MTRAITKLISQALLVVGPMLTLQWSLVDYIGHQISANSVTVNLLFFSLTGPKPTVELQLRIIISIVGLVPLIVYEIKDVILPRRDLAEFRSVYLAREKEIWRDLDPENRIPADVRINIMHVRHPWYTLFLGRFYWTWNDGFDPPNQKDANMFLLRFQGVAGIAYRKKDATEGDFRELPPRSVRWSDYGINIIVASVIVVASIIVYFAFRPASPLIYFLVAFAIVSIYLTIGSLFVDPYYLWPWQIKKTEYVKYILSIPMFRASQGNSKTFKCVGVINLDTTTDTGADFLDEFKQELIDYFLDRGKIIACLR